MKSVSKFEANLLRILQAFLGRLPLDAALPLLVAELERPRCLSRACVEVAQDMLAKCVTAILAHEAWPRERFLRKGQPASGRLWQRTAPADLGLTFSGVSLDFLLWCTSSNLLKGALPPFKSPPTVGDRLLFVLAYDRLRDTELANGLLRLTSLTNDALFGLLYAEDCGGKLVQDWLGARAAEANPQPAARGGRPAPRPAEQGPLDGAPTPDRIPQLECEAWLTDGGGAVLEAFQTRLANQWYEIEKRKYLYTDPRMLTAVGVYQGRLLEQFLAAADRAGRRDLTRFLLRVGRRLLLHDNEYVPPYFRHVRFADLRLADRSRVYQAGLALFHHLETLEGWERAARAVSYVDEDYAASQLWKADFEALEGAKTCSRARITIREVQPLQTSG